VSSETGRECRRDACHHSGKSAIADGVRRKMAGRAIAQSRSTQQTMSCRAVRCRALPRWKKFVTAAKPLRVRSQDRHEPDRRRQEREFSRAFCKARAEPCNTRFRFAAISARPAWNGMGTRSARRLFLFQVRESCNDSRSRSTKRSQPQRSYNVPLLSRRFNRRGGVVAQTFSSRSMMGAIGPDGILSGGTTSGSGPVDLGAAGTSCLIRVAINMALKSNAAAT
jgi:hypothetical protein